MIALTLLCFFLSKADAVWDRVKSHLEKIPGDYTSHRVTRAGDQTLELETFISTEGDLDSAAKIFSDYPNYRNWMLKNINERPSGEEFLIKFTDLKFSKPDRMIQVAFNISVGSFQYTGERTFQITGKRSTDRFSVEIHAVSNTTSIISQGGATLSIFPVPGKPGRLWGYIIGKTRLRSKVLYTLLPSAALQGEAGLRINTAIRNFSEWDTQR